MNRWPQIYNLNEKKQLATIGVKLRQYHTPPQTESVSSTSRQHSIGDTVTFIDSPVIFSISMSGDALFYILLGY